MSSIHGENRVINKISSLARENISLIRKKISFWPVFYAASTRTKWPLNNSYNLSLRLNLIAAAKDCAMIHDFCCLHLLLIRALQIVSLFSVSRWSFVWRNALFSSSRKNPIKHKVFSVANHSGRTEHSCA